MKSRTVDQSWLEPHYAWIVAGLIVVILYGSFFPFDFYRHRDPRGPLGVLLASPLWAPLPGDVITNILLYVPFGFFAVHALQKRTLAAIAAVILVGFALSLFVEVAQFYARGRFQEISDICANALGTALGAVAGAISRRRMRSPFLALMVVCWLGNRWYPFFPFVHTIRWRHLSLAAFPPLDLFRFFVVWLAIGLMLEALCTEWGWKESHSRRLLPCLLGSSLAMQALIAGTIVQSAEVAGGAAATLVWIGFLWRLRARAVIVSVLFVALVALLALSPFHFTATRRDFGWTPFRSFIEGAPGSTIRSFFEKTFLYGGLVWLLQRTGCSSGTATIFGALLVFCLRWAQTYLPGRSAEITDAVLLLMLAGMMKLISLARPYQPASR